MENRNHKVHKVIKGTGEIWRHDVEPIASFIPEPVLDHIGDIFGCSTGRKLAARAGDNERCLSECVIVGARDLHDVIDDALP